MPTPGPRSGAHPLTGEAAAARPGHEKPGRESVDLVELLQLPARLSIIAAPAAEPEGRPWIADLRHHPALPETRGPIHLGALVGEG